MIGHHAMPKRRAGQAGFTLIELLVASIAGLFVVLAAFMLSRGATRLFAAEGRVANSQLNVRLGIDRLRQDLERAGYMSSANVMADPDVCPKPVGTPLQSVMLRPGSSSTSGTETPMSEANGLFPDRITIAGNFASTDVYLAATILPSSGGAGVDITLQKTWGSTARLLSASETSTPETALTAVFAPDRLIRVRNNVGVSQFLVIASSKIDTTTGRAVITTKGAPAYVSSNDGNQIDKRCGGSGFCLGCEVNPVQLIRYEIGALTDAKFAWAYPTGTIGDKNKYDLIRRELNPDGSTVPDSEEIVAEYAVDLGFAFGVDSSPPAVAGSAWIEPTLESLAFGAANNMLYGASISASASTRPQRIRSIRYRLTTRTRFPDYNSATDDGGAGLGRYKLGPDQFSRARTIIGDVALMNQQGIRW